MKIMDSAVAKIGLTIANLNLLVDASHVFIHGEIFTEPKFTTMLKEHFYSQPKLFNPPRHKQELVIKPYSVYTGAIGASALCVYHLSLIHI